jgi:hypothetical protein
MLIQAPEALFLSSEMGGLLRAGHQAIESGRRASENQDITGLWLRTWQEKTKTNECLIFSQKLISYRLPG